MQITTPDFKAKSRTAIADPHLQSALGTLRENFSGNRASAVERLPEFEALRDAGRELKNHVLDNLDYYLERFETAATQAGSVVHWASTPDEACQIIADLCDSVDARVVGKSKSMISEEIALNPFLEKRGYDVLETDLGEYIVQLADEPPSHIIGPAVHKTVDQVADLFAEHHAQYGKTKRLTDGPDLVAEAREILRDKYFDADVAISGANFLIAETGSSVIVTNEGNGDFLQGLAGTHIVLASLEKLIPTLDDMNAIMRLLGRSATGQDMAAYTTVTTGPRRDGNTDGPEQVHIVLLDNGRSAMLGTPLQEVLRCIRCGACMNHCPVYGAVGGHAYGWVYPGPIGSVMTPALIGVEKGGNLPNASTFCGKCEQVCPMRIPLPKMMRHWRRMEFEAALPPAGQRVGLALWAWFAKRPALYQTVTGLAARTLSLFAGRKHALSRLPLAGGWTGGRAMPAPEGRTFQAQWAARGGSRGKS